MGSNHKFIKRNAYFISDQSTGFFAHFFCHCVSKSFFVESESSIHSCFRRIVHILYCLRNLGIEHRLNRRTKLCRAYSKLRWTSVSSGFKCFWRQHFTLALAFFVFPLDDSCIVDCVLSFVITSPDVFIYVEGCCANIKPLGTFCLMQDSIFIHFVFNLLILGCSIIKFPQQ